jgi:hypothetical protein
MAVLQGRTPVLLQQVGAALSGGRSCCKGRRSHGGATRQGCRCYYRRHALLRAAAVAATRGGGTAAYHESGRWRRSPPLVLQRPATGAAKADSDCCKRWRTPAAGAANADSSSCGRRPPELQTPDVGAARANYCKRWQTPATGRRSYNDRPLELQRPIAAAGDAGHRSCKHRTSELQRSAAASGGGGATGAGGGDAIGGRRCFHRWEAVLQGRRTSATRRGGGASSRS